MKARKVLAAAVSAVLMAAALAGCGSDTNGTNGSAGPLVPQQSQDVPQPSGEIWQLALGRDAFEDPYLQRYTSGLGRSSKTDVYQHAEGFVLDLDAEGVVEAVVLYNDETQLGWGGSSTAFRAYQGRLPGGLTWADTPATLGAAYGDDNQSGGWGTEITFSYHTDDGYDLVVSTTAGHESELAGARIHSITVTRS